MKFLGFLLLAVCPLLFVACQTMSTGHPDRRPGQFAVSSRISQHSDQFSKLSSSHQKAVRQGKVVKGMSNFAVRLAWGRPDEVKSLGGKKEKWIYYRTEEVVFRDPGAGTKWSRFYQSTEKYYDGHTHDEFRAVKQEDRTVHFENGRVVSWTQSRY